MASTNPKKPRFYTADNGAKYVVRLSESRAVAGGFPIANGQTAGKWPFKTTRMRHVQVLFDDGTRGSFAIAENAGKYDVGGAFTATVSGVAKTGNITSHTGEKFQFQ